MCFFFFFFFLCFFLFLAAAVHFNYNHRLLRQVFRLENKKMAFALTRFRRFRFRFLGLRHLESFSCARISISQDFHSLRLIAERVVNVQK